MTPDIFYEERKGDRIISVFPLLGGRARVAVARADTPVFIDDVW